MSKSKQREEDRAPAETRPSDKTKFEIYGEEMIGKKVRPGGTSGRVYVPPDWADRHVKIIRMD